MDKRTEVYPIQKLIGLVGALIGGFLASLPGIGTGGLIGTIIIASSAHVS